jgi:hypothetical protein
VTSAVVFTSDSEMGIEEEESSEPDIFDDKRSVVWCTTGNQAVGLSFKPWV